MRHHVEQDADVVVLDRVDRLPGVGDAARSVMSGTSWPTVMLASWLSRGEDVRPRKHVELALRFQGRSVAVKSVSSICTIDAWASEVRDAEVRAALLTIAAGAEVQHRKLRAEVGGCCRG